MPTWTPTKNWEIAVAPTAAELNSYFGANGNTHWLHADRPHCELYVTGNTSINNNGIPTFIDWNAELLDNDSMHDNATNPSRITINTPGFYLLWCQFEWEYTDVSARSIECFVNAAKGPTLPYRQLEPATILPTDVGGANTFHSGAWVHPLQFGDHVEFAGATNTNPATINVVGNSGGARDKTRCGAVWLYHDAAITGLTHRAS